jgi:hypothetical protein
MARTLYDGPSPTSYARTGKIVRDVPPQHAALGLGESRTNVANDLGTAGG